MFNVTSPRGDDAAIELEIQAKGKTAPRVTPQDIDRAIVSKYCFTAWEAVDKAQSEPIRGSDEGPLSLLTICVLVLRNGFTVTGESACASPENFDAEIGKKIAFENAKQKIWALEGYRLKSYLFDLSTGAAS